MIRNDQELKVTLERIAHFQRQVTHLRNVETNPANYHLSCSRVCPKIWVNEGVQVAIWTPKIWDVR